MLVIASASVTPSPCLGLRFINTWDGAGRKFDDQRAAHGRICLG
jgi:hypothetical protein